MPIKKQKLVDFLQSTNFLSGLNQPVIYLLVCLSFYAQGNHGYAIDGPY